MSRSLNLTLLKQMQARKPALESDVAEVPGTDAEQTTETPPVVEPVAAEAGTGEAPTVIIKVEVEQASKPAETVAPETTDAATTEVVGGELEAVASVETPAATEVAAEVPAETVAEAAPAEVEAVAEVPAQQPAETPAETEVPAADGVEAAAGDAEQVAAPAETAAETSETTDAAPAEQAETAAEPEASVDAAPTQSETDAAAAEVQAAVDATKTEGEEEPKAVVESEQAAVVPAAEVTDETIDAATQIGPVDEVEVLVDTPVAVEVDEISQELATYDNGSNALDKIGDILEAAAEEGGVDGTTARVLEVAVEHIHQTLGLPRSVGIVAMEAFEQQDYRGRATNIAMEDIKRTAADVWKAIVEGMKQLIAKVVEFYDQVASGALMQQRRAASILAAVAKLGDKKVDGVIKSPSLSKALAMGNTVSKNIARDLMTAEQLLNKAYSHGAELANMISVATKEADQAAAAQKLLASAKQIVNAIMTPDNELSDKGVNDAPENTTGAATPLMLGNNLLWAYVPNSEAELAKLRFGKTSMPVEIEGDSLVILSTAEIKAIATVAASSAKGLAIAKQTGAKLKQAASDFEAYARQAVTQNKQPQSPVLSALRNLSIGLTKDAAQIAYAVNGAALSYCEASLKKLGVQSVEPAAQPAAAAA